MNAKQLLLRTHPDKRGTQIVPPVLIAGKRFTGKKYTAVAPVTQGTYIVTHHQTGGFSFQICPHGTTTICSLDAFAKFSSVSPLGADGAVTFQTLYECARGAYQNQRKRKRADDTSDVYLVKTLDSLVPQTEITLTYDFYSSSTCTRSTTRTLPIDPERVPPYEHVFVGLGHTFDDTEPGNLHVRFLAPRRTALQKEPLLPIRLGLDYHVYTSVRHEDEVKCGARRQIQHPAHKTPLLICTRGTNCDIRDESLTYPGALVRIKGKGASISAQRTGDIIVHFSTKYPCRQPAAPQPKSHA